MSDSTISPPGIPSPADPAVAAAVDRWVAAAGDDPAGALASVVQQVAAAADIDVELVVADRPVAPDAAVEAVSVADSVLTGAGPWLPGFVREALLAPDRRRRAGVHHTSPAMAAALVKFVAGLHSLDATVVADPAVGGGVFLLAACRQMSGPLEERVRRVEGCDIDPLAVGVTEASLRLWAGGVGPPAGAIRVADSLAGGSYGRRPGLVIGNPPFLSQLRDDTARDAERRAMLRARWPDLGGYVDDAAAFMLAAVEQVVDGGVVALVQPRSFLAARDAEPVRARLLRDAPPIGLWIDGDRQFGAEVDTITLVAKKGAVAATVARAAGVPARAWSSAPAVPDAGSWGGLLLPDTTPRIDRASIRTDGIFGDVAHVTAGFRDQFYGLRGAVADDPEGAYRLITSGLIDPLRSRWGTTACRFDRQKWLHPSVDPNAVAPEIAEWLAARLRPKLLVASQTKVLEVVIDSSGHLVPCTPVVSVEPTAQAPSLAHLAAALSSPVLSLLLLESAAGSALSRDAMRVSASAIAALPLPPVGSEWDAAAEAVSRLGAAATAEDHAELAHLTMAAYGVDERTDIVNWWQPRLPCR